MRRSNTLIECVILLLLVCSCSGNQTSDESEKKDSQSIVISKEKYKDQLEGFWLGQCIANWTGLVTEMDKIGNIGEIKTGDFYTRDDWGKPDQPAIWAEGKPSDLSPTIDFVFRNEDEVWGADDDTDIEYMYQFLLANSTNLILKPKEIQAGWLKHIKSEEENYLWVSNQQAFDLMSEGILPPETSHPDKNPHFEMIDAQLTTEIFGLFSPARPDFALKMANLPIRTTARSEAQQIAEFYVLLYSLASYPQENMDKKQQLMWMAETARKHLINEDYPAKMYDFVLAKYKSGASWEQARDSVYQRYQVESADGYDITEKELYCNGCFAAGINFAAGMISYFYGEGDIKETIKIGALAGWDSDNPTATWGGLVGFMMGKKEIEASFGQMFSNKFNIHRTRQNFPNDGIDNFSDMADIGISIIDRVVKEEIGLKDQAEKGYWIISLTE